MLQEEKLVSYTSKHIPRKSNGRPRTLAERMHQAIDLASGTNVPVNANSTITGSYGSTNVIAGTPSQMISDPTGIFSGLTPYGVDFDLTSPGVVLQQYTTSSSSFAINTYEGYDSSTSTSYKAGTNTAKTYSQTISSYFGTSAATYTGSYANDVVCLNGNNASTCVTGLDFFMYNDIVTD